MRHFAEGSEGILAVGREKPCAALTTMPSKLSPLHLVSAWAEEQRLVLGQLAVDDKSNEITALPKLLEMLTLRGKVVTADAMHCQRQVAQQVIEQGGDYALALKGNQGSLRDDVQLFLDDPSTPLAQDVQISKGHGRIETRIASVSSDVDWLQETHHWPGLSAVGKVTAIRRKDGAESEQSRYYLLSETCSAERFNYIVRGHWGIENRLHWVLDVTCHEDQARNRKGHCAENLAFCGSWR